MSVLGLHGLSKTYGDVRALETIDLRVEAGELCVLLGPSGCGKSTLLRCFAGLEPPDGGEIRLDGRRANGLEPRARNVAMVFQSYALYPHWNVRRNLEFPLRMRGTPRAERERRVLETARLLRIEELLDRRPRQLSGGQRQRVAIGRAIVRDPSLFLFDEPLSNLDAQLRQEMRLEIVRLHRRLRTTVLYVTHDQVEAMTLGQRLVVMRAGRIEQVGTPQEIYARPATRFVAGFVGAPTMNFLDGVVAEGVFACGGLRVPVELPVEGAVTLGVRPEDVRLGDGPGRARVEWIEDLGPERYAHLRADGIALTARGEAEEGAEVRYGFEPGRLHLFRDGRRLG